MNNFSTNKEKTIKTAIGIILSVVITVTLAVALIAAKCDANAKPVSSEDSEIYKVIDEFSIDSHRSIITVEDKETGIQYMVVTYTLGSPSVAITPRIQNKINKILK